MATNIASADGARSDSSNLSQEPSIPTRQSVVTKQVPRALATSVSKSATSGVRNWTMETAPFLLRGGPSIAAECAEAYEAMSR
jgi:hypothetical protein